MAVHLWNAQTWQKIFDNNMVIVCTAEVLVQCLMHCFLNIDQINLLIFDEAHHAKKNHAYARLIKDYYLHEPDAERRPRVFGMTASPVDAKVDIKEAAQELERLLHCKIATTSDVTLVANSISRPEEIVAEYPPLQHPFDTPFVKALREKYGEVNAFKKFFYASRQLSSELGRWAADAYWSFAFSEEEARKIEMREERTFYLDRGNKPVKKLDEELALLREAAEFVRQRDFGVPALNEADLSSKVLKLYEWLKAYYLRTDEARCIVFVERRHTARLLNLIFTHLGMEHLHCDMLVGVNSTFGDLNISLRNQVLTVAKFRRGEVNCLFSTRVAEEGLDIPQCNLVVRFDLYQTMISYVQSRGRARHRNSKYLHMIEKGNPSHRETLLSVRQSERVMRNFCQNLPSDRLLDDFEESTAWKMEKGRPAYTDPKTGAKLTYGSSLGVVAHFVATLPSSHDVVLLPTYVVTKHEKGFICEVILPEGSPIPSAMGKPASKKSVAKRSAAFYLCLALRKKGYLNEHLLPTYQKQLPAMRNALLALNVKKKDVYPMRIKPEFWDIGYGETPRQLFMTIIDVASGLERPHQPIGLLTRVKLPGLPQFPIYLKDDTESSVISLSLDTPIMISEDILGLFQKTTLQVYEDIFAKVFESDVTKMSYWIVPLDCEKFWRQEITSGFNRPQDLIDWHAIRDICDVTEYRWTPEMKDEFLADRYFIDIWNGGRRFYSIGVTPDLKPLDPVPTGVPKNKFMANILDYSVSLWSKSREKRKWILPQPVVKVEQIPFRRNFLAPVGEKETDVKETKITYVCPEPIRISAMNTRFVAMCYVFPAIIHRFDSYLISLDACDLLGLKIGPKLALEALTKDSDNSDEHGEEKINFRSGMGPNYERLEFMGDCFLKMATSISIFVQQPEENEFEFHVRRMCLLCNKNLFRSALNLKLYEYIRTMAFSRFVDVIFRIAPLLTCCSGVRGIQRG